jgi:hypothetical protein
VDSLNHIRALIAPKPLLKGGHSRSLRRLHRLARLPAKKRSTGTLLTWQKVYFKVEDQVILDEDLSAFAFGRFWQRAKLKLRRKFCMNESDLLEHTAFLANVEYGVDEDEDYVDDGNEDSLDDFDEEDDEEDDFFDDDFDKDLDDDDGYENDEDFDFDDDIDEDDEAY